jgi:hypothetical protein
MMSKLRPRAIFDEYQDTTFKLVKLAPSVASQDYEVVMRNQVRLRAFFKGIMDWPKTLMTLADNIESLAHHQREFEQREAFAFSVFKVSSGLCIGSVYIDPSRSIEYDCELYFWLDEKELRLEQQLATTVCGWLRQAWGLSRIALVGREIALKVWIAQLKRQDS